MNQQPGVTFSYVGLILAAAAGASRHADDPFHDSTAIADHDQIEPAAVAQDGLTCERDHSRGFQLPYTILSVILPIPFHDQFQLGLR